MVPGTITPDTRLVLANAIYFKGTWKVQFDAKKTEFAPFYRLDGSQVKVPMMRVKEHFPYTEGMNYQAIELPYTGNALSMVIFLPREGMFEDFEAGLSVERLDAIMARLCSEKVQLAMPKFELTSEFSLADTLAELGMPDAFTGVADFSGMDGTRDLFIGHVAHKAYVSVNEEGTEAAAATGVSMVLSIPAMMTIDHPFIFLIRDIETGAILFIGRVMDPSEGTSGG
jgi:serpin B